MNRLQMRNRLVEIETKYFPRAYEKREFMRTLAIEYKDLFGEDGWLERYERRNLINEPIQRRQK